LLNTTTTQNVACPMMMVQIEKVRPKMLCPKLIAEDKAIAVTIPGRAIGSTRANEIVSRPKNRNRWTAKAAREPRSIAVVVAPTAACREPASALGRAGSRQAARNHSRDHRSGGHALVMPLLKA
jgi:hypothetical protein